MVTSMTSALRSLERRADPRGCVICVFGETSKRHVHSCATGGEVRCGLVEGCTWFVVKATSRCAAITGLVTVVEDPLTT